MRSLRTRLLLYGALVATASLAVLIAVMSRGVRLEVETRTELTAGPAGPGGGRGEPAQSVADELSKMPSSEWPAALDRAARRAGKTLVLLRRSDSGPQIVVMAPSESPPPEIRHAPEGLRFLRRSADGAVQEEFRFSAPLATVTDGSSQVVAGLLVVPPPSPRGGLAEKPPLSIALRRWLAIAAAASITVALGLGVLLARRISQPIEALTSAVERLRSGSAGSVSSAGDVRVEVAGDDEIGKLSRSFNELVDELARSEGARQRMVADVAHELRTPLGRLRVQLEAIQDGVLDSSAARSAALLADVSLLSRLVADLQDLALADAQRLELRQVDVAFDPLVERTVAQHESPAQAAGVTLHCTARSGSVGRADPDRLEQILGNLLDNALAWTPRGGTVSVLCYDERNDVILRVVDDGPGIEPHALPHVFDRFYRADRSRVRDGRGGSGLGLAIVQALVTAHGGQVEAASPPGAGTQVTVRLPRTLTGS